VGIRADPHVLGIYGPNSKFWLSTIALGSSGLLIAIIDYRSFVLSVLLWGWGEKNRKETDPRFGKYCVPLQ